MTLKTPIKMKRYIILAVAMISMLLLLSCSRSIAPLVTTHDSTRVQTSHTEVYRETPLAPDSARVAARLNCDSLGNVYLAALSALQGERVKQELVLSNNTLTVTATDRAKERIVYIKRDSLVYRDKETPVPYPVEVEVNRLTLWQKALVWFGAACGLAISSYGAYLLVVKGKLSIVLKLVKSLIQ